MTEHDIMSSMSLDAFHRGKFFLLQPRNFGHRAGIDAMMLASLVPRNFKGKIADLGAGAGAAGFAVAARCKDTHIFLIEISSIMLKFAQKNILLKQNEYLKSRISLLNADVTLKGKNRALQGLTDNLFDFVIMNPPFNAPSDRVTPDSEKAKAHVMTPTLFEDWLRTAAAILQTQGCLGLIARPSSLSTILKGLEGRFGGIIIIPIYARLHQNAIRILIFAKKASRAPSQICEPLILHEQNGHHFTSRANAINNGLISIWDEY